MKAFNKIPDILTGMMKRINKFYSTHVVGKLIATVFAFFLILWLAKFIYIQGVKENPIPEIQYNGLLQEGNEIAQDAGKVLVAESDSKQLYINSKTLSLTLKDKNTGKEWRSAIEGAKEGSELALLSVSYLGDDNNLYEWDSYQYCTALGSYSLYQVDNGVKIKLHMNEGESQRYFEYFSEKIPTDRYENFFMKGIQDLVDAGKLDKLKGDKYKQTLDVLYNKSTLEGEDCYTLANNGNPPTSAAKLLIEMGKLLGYTKEMLIDDNNAMGLASVFIEPAVFDITVEATLEGDDFVVQVPTQEMVSGNDFYTIQNIKVLPNFGANTANDKQEGYAFVPDGAGALFKFNTYNTAVPEYKRPVYDNDYYSDYFYMPEFADELMMPVFGMLYGADQVSDNGFLGIIETGAETSYIQVKLAAVGKDSPSAYNKAFASFDTAQYDRVKIFGELNESQATYLADTGMLDIDYKIRYKLFPDKVTYFDMAKTYQQYLMKEWNITKMNYPDKAKLYLDFIGTLSLTKRFVGIPYDSLYSMTTYKEMTDIIKDLGDMNYALQYSGFFNGGFENKLNNRADLVKANGTEKELSELESLAKEKNIDLFFETSLSKIYHKGNGFSAKVHGLYDYSNYPVEIYRYSPAIGIFNGAYNFWEVYKCNLISPRYLDGVVDGFLKDAKTFDKLSITDLANMNYPDYRFRKQISIYEANEIVTNNLKKISAEKELSLNNPMMKNVVYGKYAENISRESSNYATMYTTIPFRQLVMNGLIQVTTQNVNMTSNDAAYYVLQAVELGVYPKFTLSAKNVDVLKYTKNDNYYATEYSVQKETMNKVYAECKKAWDAIGTMEITNHKMLQDHVFYTEYASGASVITNYNLHSVVVDGKEIEALSYLLIQE